MKTAAEAQSGLEEAVKGQGRPKYLRDRGKAADRRQVLKRSLRRRRASALR
jgi:hypothetical protein